MAIVKLQNGNVLLKDGKVSCSCCAVTECCLYPASALLDGLYSGEDLPENVTIFGTSVPRELGDRLGYSDGRFELFAYNGQWELQDTAVEPPTFCSQDCLVDDICDIQDQFADSYTFAAAGMSPPSVVVTRRSLCRWDFFEEDPEGGGRYWILEYANDRRPDALWYFTIPSTFPGYKIGLQNSPVGTYTGSGLWTGTIS